MGEVSHMKAITPKPRPLGFVKKESVHFEEVGSNFTPQYTEVPSVGTQPSLYFYGRAKTDGDIRQDLRSMRDLQETLRQAALLNIVAAVNNENSVPAAMSSNKTGNTQAPGIKGASLLGHSLLGSDNTKLAVGHGGLLDHTGGGFSRHLYSGPSLTPVAPPNTALNHLIGHRSRTISIPRPRTHGEQESFMHGSLAEAKEQLTNITSFRARAKHELGDNVIVPLPNISISEANDVKDSEHQTANTVCGVSSKPPEVSNVSYALRGIGLEPSGAHNSDPKMSKDEQRAHNVHQMQMLKRHISTNKKRELVKRLTEIAKCEAVDVNEAIEGDTSRPVLILAQSKPPSRLDYSTPDLPGSAKELMRTKSNGSLHDQVDGNRVPSNTRVQSETLESILTHREVKHVVPINPEDNLRVNCVNNSESAYSDAIHSKLMGVHNNDAFTNGDVYQYPDVNTWIREHRLNSFFPKNNQYNTPDVLELRPLATSPLQSNRNTCDKKRILISRRGMNPVLRDKLTSPSPVVYEASFHRPKASIGQISLVGQSLPSLSVSKPSVLSQKSGLKHQTQDDSRVKTRSRRASHDEDLTPVRLWSDQPDRPPRGALKPWGSIARQTTSDSPILKTEILDHLQCVGIVDRRPSLTSQRKMISKVTGFNKLGDDDSEDHSSDDEEFQQQKLAVYRRSKLYSAFRASEENLANLAEVSSMVSDALTARSYLNQPLGKMEPTLPPPPPSREQQVPESQVEPRYMGCSSRVSENEMRSQFHFVNDKDEAEAKQGGNFKVFKALDQDVYFDFQHKKYRGSNMSNSTLNTAANKPRMHFIKIKFAGESKS